MDVTEIKDLLTQFDSSTLTEFDLKEGSFELYMNKNKTSTRVNETVTVAPTPAAVTVAPAAPATVESEGATPKASTAGKEIKSPIVGIVYLQPSPDKPNFKAVGDTVKKGEVVCIVEAMKLMNEIVSEYDGVIAEVLVENEAVVEFDQPLFKVEV
jgi:acetyl-CoA carboxylase biotin carboxyl carrier protein